MPMKIFVVCSGALGANPYAFIAVFMAARLPRYLGLAYLGAQMGDNAFAYLKAHRWDLVWFAVVLTVVLFAMVKIFDWWKARQAH
jgi:membrane protein DedA with SNARE-associated domain